MGKVIFRYGTMGSSKSAHLLMTGYNFEEKKRKVFYLKPEVDTRSLNFIESRVGLKKECILLGNNRKITDLLGGPENIIGNIILVDESQFLTTAEVNELTQLADQLDILVICYGLRTDSNSHLFEGSKRLFEMADTLEEIKSTCECGKKTVMNGKYYQYGFILSEQQVDIGANEKYRAVCRKCWTDNLIK